MKKLHFCLTVLIVINYGLALIILCGSSVLVRSLEDLRFASLPLEDSIIEDSQMSLSTGPASVIELSGHIRGQAESVPRQP